MDIPIGRTVPSTVEPLHTKTQSFVFKESKPEIDDSDQALRVLRRTAELRHQVPDGAVLTRYSQVLPSSGAVQVAVFIDRIANQTNEYVAGSMAAMICSDRWRRSAGQEPDTSGATDSQTSTSKGRTKMTTLPEIGATESRPGDATVDIDLGAKGALADRIREANAEMARMIEQGTLREAHRKARNAHLLEAQTWIQNAWRKRSHWFANGSDITPENIAPKLVLVESTEQRDLFRLARYTWSLPYSKGYGRRLRFLIVDEGHDVLMGVLGLQSAPINFSPRDGRVSYPENRKVELVNQTMDAFTLGAVPPYNRLLGGKLVICAAASKEIADAYREKYSGATTWIDGNTLPAHLVMVTSTSAYGRSSIYNRVNFRDPDTGDSRKVAVPLGYTKGYGNFHLHEVYQDIKKFLNQQGYKDTNKGYGRGPKPVWQNISKTLTMLGMSHQGLNHGIPRQAWGIPLAENAWEYLNGEDEEPNYYDIAFKQLAAWWKKRWLLPRAERITDWRDWQKTSLLESITVAEPAVRPVSAEDANGMSSQAGCDGTG